MYEVTVTMVVSASHHLRGYQGSCENVHGHNYKIQATVGAEELDETGLALDFRQLRTYLAKVAGKYDHSDLNQHPEFAEINPSSENMARIIYHGLDGCLRDHSEQVLRVSVWESEGSFVTYHEGRG